MSVDNFNNIPKTIRHCPYCGTDTPQERVINAYAWECFVCNEFINDIDTVVVPPAIKDEIQDFAVASSGVSLSEAFFDEDEYDQGLARKLGKHQW